MRMRLHRTLEWWADMEVDRNLTKMLTYMDAFSRFRTLNTLSQLETLMGSYTQLEMFEKAQLGR